ncbi:MAG TPA: hypothetical protein VGP72_03080 [Planctomycetota bacterium]|jgi:hypothetical protein
MWIVVAIALLALLLNVPLGAWRARVPKFSAKWFAAVHLSVPFIWAMRMASGISLRAIPLFIALAVAGQILGARLFPPRE